MASRCVWGVWPSPVPSRSAAASWRRAWWWPPWLSRTWPSTSTSWSWAAWTPAPSRARSAICSPRSRAAAGNPRPSASRTSTRWAEWRGRTDSPRGKNPKKKRDGNLRKADIFPRWRLEYRVQGERNPERNDVPVAQGKSRRLQHHGHTFDSQRYADKVE